MNTPPRGPLFILSRSCVAEGGRTSAAFLDGSKAWAASCGGEVGRGGPEQRSAPGAKPGVRLAILGRRAPAVRPAACQPGSPALLTHTIPDTQLDGIEFGNPVMMDRQKWAMDMAMQASQLPPGAHGAGVYSSHPNDTTGTWRGDAAVIAQIDAECAAKK